MDLVYICLACGQTIPAEEMKESGTCPKCGTKDSLVDKGEE